MAIAGRGEQPVCYPERMGRVPGLSAANGYLAFCLCAMTLGALAMTGAFLFLYIRSYTGSPPQQEDVSLPIVVVTAVVTVAVVVAVSFVFAWLYMRRHKERR